MTDEKAGIIKRVCSALGVDEIEQARNIIRAEYRHEPPVDITEDVASFPSVKPVAIFLRDGFVDCYTARRLVFPGTLRIISMRLGKDFPYHSHWQMEQCHFAYYELFPVIDHKNPRARGGARNNPLNLVTTSTVMNAAKAGFTIKELDWALPDAATLKEKWWDGMMGWFFEETKNHPELKNDSMIARWHRAASAFRGKPPGQPIETSKGV